MLKGPLCARCGQPHAPSTLTCPVAGTPLAPSASAVGPEDVALIGGDVDNRYRVTEVLGSGSTGTVFAVEHLVTGRPAALKVLRPRHATRERLEAVFHGHARAAWTVLHPGVCEVLDAGRLPDGTPFFVMERLVGEPLAARIQRERLSIGAAIDIAMQLLSALDALHAREALLVDLRPRNIFLSHRRGCRPVVKLLDCGLARLVPLDRVRAQWDALADDGGREPTDAAVSLDVPSPERARGEPSVGPAGDLFAVAVVVYEAVTGRRPFVASSFDGLLVQIAQGLVTPMTELRPDVPRALDALVLRALSAAPEARPRSAASMQDELRALFDLAGRAAPYPPSAPPDARSPASDAVSSGAVSSSVGGVALPSVREPFADETETHRAVTPSLGDGRRPALDEAAADHPTRTLPPPTLRDAAIEIDIDVEDDAEETTARRDLGGHIAKLRALAASGRDEPEDETARLSLTPELQARIEAMRRQSAGAPTPAAEPSAPSVDPAVKPVR